MKKMLLSLMAAGFAASSFAHGGWGNGAHAGNILLYGVGSYSNMKGSDKTSFLTQNSTTIDRPHMQNWEVSPGVGFFITDNIAVGIDFNYTGSKTTLDRKSISFYDENGVFRAYSIDQMKSWNYGIGPFVRFNMPMGDRFFAFGQFEAHYLRGRETPRFTNQLGTNTFVKDDNSKGFDIGYTPAVGFMVTKCLGVTFGIGGISYEYMKTDYNSNIYAAPGTEFSSKTNNFNVTFGRQFNFGIQGYFGRGGHRHHSAEPMDDTRRMDTSDDSEDNGSRRNRRNDDE